MSLRSSAIGPSQDPGSLGIDPGLYRADLDRSDVFPVYLTPAAEGFSQRKSSTVMQSSRECGALWDRFRCANMINTFTKVEPATSGDHRSLTADLASTGLVASLRQLS